MEASNIPTELMRVHTLGGDTIDDTIPLIGDERAERGSHAVSEDIKDYNEKRNGWIGWVATAAAVTAWDMSRNETMTNAYHRGTESNLGKLAVWGATAYTIAHLNRKLPSRFDLFDRIAEWTGSRYGK